MSGWAAVSSRYTAAAPSTSPFCMSALPRLCRAVAFDGSWASTARNAASACSDSPFAISTRPRVLRASARLGVEGERLGEHGDGAVQVAPFAQGFTEVRVGGEQRRIEGDGAAELGHRRRQVAGALQGQAQVVARLGVGGLELHRLPQLRQRPGRVARPP